MNSLRLFSLLIVLKRHFLRSNSMADANLEESDFLGLTLLADIKWNDYIEYIATSAAMKFRSLCQSRQFSSPESVYYCTVH